jgi:hypothetical protein
MHGQRQGRGVAHPLPRPTRAVPNRTLEDRMPFGLLFFWCLLMPITTYDGPSNDTWDSHPAPDAKKGPAETGP